MRPNSEMTARQRQAAVRAQHQVYRDGRGSGVDDQLTDAYVFRRYRHAQPRAKDWTVPMVVVWVGILVLMVSLYYVITADREPVRIKYPFQKSTIERGVKEERQSLMGAHAGTGRGGEE
jgi:hypothetical protein